MACLLVGYNMIEIRDVIIYIYIYISYPMFDW